MSQENRPGIQARNARRESIWGRRACVVVGVCCGHRVQVRWTPLHPECGLDMETDGPKPTKRL